MSIEPRETTPQTPGDPRHHVATGVSAGIAAGLLFAFVQLAGALASGTNAAEPFRLFASIVQGEAALLTTPLPVVVGLGLTVHLALSATYGAIFAYVCRGLSDSLKLGLPMRMGVGAAYGALIWVVNLQLVGRFVYPWFLDHTPGLYLALHVLAFGVPLGILFDARDRRASRLARAPSRA